MFSQKVTMMTMMTVLERTTTIITSSLFFFSGAISGRRGRGMVCGFLCLSLQQVLPTVCVPPRPVLPAACVRPLLGPAVLARLSV